jgi:imidazolonepropionase-like amidohydrolase
MRTARLLILAAAAMSACSRSLEPPPDLVIEHVAVVNVRDGGIVQDQTIAITGNRISAVQPATQAGVLRGARAVVDGTGQFVLPGLWDMHTHIVDPDAPGGPDVSVPLFVASGVTGIRDLGSSSLDSIIQLRDAIRDGRRLGPRMQLAGKVIDGLPVVFPPDAMVAATPDQARDAVDSLVARGMDVIKAYEMLTRDAFTALVERARQLGRPLVAHVPLTFDAAEMAALGVSSMEHLRNIELSCSGVSDSLRVARTERLAIEAAQPAASGFAFDWSLGYGPGALVRRAIHVDQRPHALATHDPARCRRVLSAFAESRVWQVPTLLLNQRTYLRVDTISSVVAAQRYVPPEVWRLWQADAASTQDMTASARADLERQGQWHFELVRAMRDENVGLLAGTDVSNPYMIPGFSLHDELRMLVLAGLTPLEALQTATINPAHYLSATDSMGTVEPGHIADLVLLGANPLDDISNSRLINGVVLNGVYLDRVALDGLLANAELAANAGLGAN